MKLHIDLSLFHVFPKYVQPQKNSFIEYKKASSYLCTDILKTSLTSHPLFNLEFSTTTTINEPSALVKPVTNQGSNLLELLSIFLIVLYLREFNLKLFLERDLIVCTVFDISKGLLFPSL